jgi:hypothetical protein
MQDFSVRKKEKISFKLKKMNVMSVRAFFAKLPSESGFYLNFLSLSGGFLKIICFFSIHKMSQILILFILEEMSFFLILS